MAGCLRLRLAARTAAASAAPDAFAISNASRPEVFVRKASAPDSSSRAQIADLFLDAASIRGVIPSPSLASRSFSPSDVHAHGGVHAGKDCHLQETVEEPLLLDRDGVKVLNPLAEESAVDCEFVNDRCSGMAEV